MTKTSQKYQTVEGMICIAKPFKMIIRSASRAAVFQCQKCSQLVIVGFSNSLKKFSASGGSAVKLT